VEDPLIGELVVIESIFIMNPKRPEEVSSYEGQAPDWFTRGVEAALLAPTAFGKQAFTLSGRDGEVTLRCEDSAYAGQDRGLVKYHFEVGAGRDNFTWAH